jgi:hypothetical protein
MNLTDIVATANPTTGPDTVSLDRKFNFIMTLVSIITALGLQTILSGFARIVTNRDEVQKKKIYPLHIAAAVMSLLMQIQLAFNSFTKHMHEDWRFDQLLVFLVSPILYYVIAELLFPSRGDALVDFQGLYWKNCRWFYGITVAALLNNALADWLIPPGVPPAANVLRVIAGVVLIVVAISKSPKLHGYAYVVFILMFIAFVSLFASKLT